MATTVDPCDYLVVGAGAMGMSFVDEMLNSTTETTFVMVDKFSKPGGHWMYAYNFVTLHQPAAYYGVPSKQLGKGTDDLSTRYEIMHYYEEVMKGFLDTGKDNILYNM